MAPARGVHRSVFPRVFSSACLFSAPERRSARTGPSAHVDQHFLPIFRYSFDGCCSLCRHSLSARVSSFQLHPSYCRSHRDQPPPFSFSLRHASLVDFLCGQILQCSSLGQVRGLFFLWPQSLRCPWRSSFSTVRGLSCLAASPTL
jgi:hypothetical protein